MVEELTTPFEEIASDANIMMIIAGAAIWLIGFYVGLLGPLFTTTGFALVCFSAALTSLSRPVASAWPGMLLGGLLQLVGYYLVWIFILGPALIVIGGVMIVYFAIPLALQRGELPVLTRLQKLLESKKKKEEIKDIEAEDAEPDNPESVEEND